MITRTLSRNPPRKSLTASARCRNNLKAANAPFVTTALPTAPHSSSRSASTSTAFIVHKDFSYLPFVCNAMPLSTAVVCNLTCIPMLQRTLDQASRILHSALSLMKGRPTQSARAPNHSAMPVAKSAHPWKRLKWQLARTKSAKAAFRSVPPSLRTGARYLVVPGTRSRNSNKTLIRTPKLTGLILSRLLPIRRQPAGAARRRVQAIYRTS